MQVAFGPTNDGWVHLSCKLKGFAFTCADIPTVPTYIPAWPP